jgi:hypothetical protein
MADFGRKIFVSYASGQRATAEAIALTLRGRGYDVFFDKDQLPPGRTYDRRIQRAVDASSLFVFLISPQSVAPGCYALTELAFARQKWKSPYNRVLPVMVAPTDLAAVPAYLKAVTLLRPQGNIAAEVGAAVDGLLAAHPALGRMLFLGGFLGLVSGTASAYAYSRGSNPFAPIPENQAALLPGVLFGMAIAAMVYLWSGKSQIRSGFAGAFVFATWLVVIGILLSIGELPQPPGPLDALRLPLPHKKADDLFALQDEIHFKIILSSVVGAFGTWIGIALVSQRVRTWFSPGLVLAAGLLPVFLMNAGTFGQNLNISVLFVLWQMAVATALAYSLCTGPSRAHDLQGEPVRP